MQKYSIKKNKLDLFFKLFKVNKNIKRFPLYRAFVTSVSYDMLVNDIHNLNKIEKKENNLKYLLIYFFNLLNLTINLIVNLLKKTLIFLQFLAIFVLIYLSISL